MKDLLLKFLQRSGVEKISYEVMSPPMHESFMSMCSQPAP